jgi:hypothetical protein
MNLQLLAVRQVLRRLRRHRLHPDPLAAFETGEEIDFGRRLTSQPLFPQGEVVRFHGLFTQHGRRGITMAIRRVSVLLLACGILCDLGTRATAGNSPPETASTPMAIAKLLGECETSFADRAAVLSELYGEAYRDASEAKDQHWRLARRVPSWQARDLKFQLTEHRSGRVVLSQIVFHFNVASLPLDNAPAEATLRLRVILTIRNCATGNIRTVVSRPTVRPHAGMSSGTWFTIGATLPAVPSEFVVVGTVTVVEDGCAPEVLAERVEKVLISPSLGIDEFREFLAEANRLDGAGSESANEVVRQCLPRVRVDPLVLRMLAKSGGVRVLDLSERVLTDEDFQQLQALVDLKDLSLAGTKVDVASINGLAACRGLESLDISSSQLSHENMSILVKHRSIRRLNLANCSVDPRELRLLAGMSQLTDLNVSGTRFDDAHVEALAALPDLRSIRLASTRISSSSVRRLAALRRLEVLDLSGTKVDDTDLDLLLRLPALRELIVVGTRVTGKVLRAGLQESNLAHVTVDSTQYAALPTIGLQCVVQLSD